MGQLGFFDADKRLAALSAKGDPLEAIDRLVPSESFRADIEAVVLTPEEMRKSRRQEAARCDCDVSNAGFAGAQQSFGRAGAREDDTFSRANFTFDQERTICTGPEGRRERPDLVPRCTRRRMSAYGGDALLGIECLTRASYADDRRSCLC